MRIKGFLAVLVLIAVGAYFIMTIKSKQVEGIEGQVDAFLSVKTDLTKTNMAALQRAVNIYIAQVGKNPETLQDLRRMQPMAAAQVDGWGKIIRYEMITEDRFRLTSAGPDGVFRTRDDIVMDY